MRLYGGSSFGSIDSSISGSVGVPGSGRIGSLPSRFPGGGVVEMDCTAERCGEKERSKFRRDRRTGPRTETTSFDSVSRTVAGWTVGFAGVHPFGSAADWRVVPSSPVALRRHLAVTLPFRG